MTGRPARIAFECLIVAVLLAAGFWYGRFSSIHALTQPDYHYLIPAASVAVGKGFNAPLQVDGTPMGEFITARAPAVAWSDAMAMQVGPPDQFHQSARYLIYLVGYWWRVVGISWAGIADVAGVLHAMAVLGSYALLRLLVPLPFAALGALWICTSTLQLALVPHVRDYSKGAFTYCVLPLIVLLALREMKRWQLLVTAAAAGAVIGLGLGFKMDIAIMTPVAIAGIILFRGARPWADVGLKVQAVSALVAGLLIAAGPVLYRLSSDGSNGFHVILLGFAGNFDASLGIEPSAYSFLPFYSDAYVVRMVQAHSGLDHWLPFPSAESDAAGRALWFDLIRHFPADIFARALAAANAVMNLCFTSRDPSFLTRPLPWQDGFVSIYAALNRLQGLGLLVAGLFVFVSAWSSVRRGALAVLLLLVLAGYPSLQFDSRHYFHAQIVPVVAILVLAWSVIAAAFSRTSNLRASLARPLVATAVLLVSFTAVPLSALRWYQSAHLDEALSQYLDLRTQVPTEVSAEGAATSLVRWPQPPVTSEALRSSHYVVEFQDDGEGVPLNVGVRYDAASPGHDYSRVLSLLPARGTNRIGFSIFNVPGQSEFAGVELGAASLRRLTGVYRIPSGGPANLPIDVRLPGDWTDRTLYQRLLLEGPDAGAVPPRQVVCAAAPGCQRLLGYLDRLAEAPPVTPDAVGMIHSPIATVASAITIDGRVDNESSYLLQLKDRALTGRGAFVAEGYLTRGGVAIGLLKERAWYRQAIISTPGAFVVIVPVDESGTYTPLITNAMSPGQRENHLVITRAGFLDSHER